ncbi:MAG: class I SAM-dependent methyltransferase [Ignavibacteriaceae bacterium]|nr:class I SAM-dependent methyltransferase [Ignavibacteriaceae bacterium]
MKKDNIEATIQFLEYLFADYSGNNFQIKLWDGTSLNAKHEGEIKFVVKINDAGVIRDIFLPPSELKITESFFFNRINIEGDLICAIESAQELILPKLNLNSVSKIFRMLLKLSKEKQLDNSKKHIAREVGREHSISRDKESVSFHYDVSNDFYKIWLDKNLVYSGAYFETHQQNLNEAQISKFEQICRSLELKRGESLLDIGCGWGSFIIYAAKNYGVSCKGITLSKEQATLANKRIEEEGLSSLCKVEVQDYRELNLNSKFDKITSIEMLHHVGGKNLKTFFSIVNKLLTEDGRSFIIAITKRNGSHFHNPEFAKKYFMPDYHLVTIGELLRYAEQSSFEITDLESWREHYYLTAQSWIDNLEKNHSEVLKFVDESIFRVWKLSFAVMAYGFKSGLLNFYRFVLIKNNSKKFNNSLTRKHLY